MDQVFVDKSGRRRRLARIAGVVVGCLLAAYMAVVASGLLTGSGAPFTPWPGASNTPQTAPRARGDADPPPSHSPSRHASPRPTPRPRTTRRTSASPRSSAIARGHGRAYGLTKSPNPRKPTG